jgi:hypothetical protein
MVFSFEPVANSLRIPEKKITPVYNFLLSLMPLQHKVKKLKFCLEPLEIRENRVFATEANIKILLLQERKGLYSPSEIKPERWPPLRIEKSESVSSSRKLIPDFNVAPDSSENFNMGKKGGNLHHQSSSLPILPESERHEKK